MISEEFFAIVPKAGMILMAGGIGSGKSATAYSLLEEIHTRDPGRKIYAYNFPPAKGRLLPEYITPTYNAEFEEGSVVIADEAYFKFYSKENNSDLNKFMDVFSGLVRQKGILVIFITQTTRKLTLSSVSGVQVFLVKTPDVMMTKLDRSELRKILQEALSEYRKLPLGQRKSSTYVISMDYEGLMLDTNTPPSFWTEELSRAWEGVRLEEEKNTLGVCEELFKEVNAIGTLYPWDDNEVLPVLDRVSDALKGYVKREVEGLDVDALRRLYQPLTAVTASSSPHYKRLLGVLTTLESLTRETP